MVYHTSDSTRDRAEGRGMQALVDLVNDLCSLAEEQGSCSSILRYMTLAFQYDIRFVIIGQSPYPDHLVPYLGSAYSQANGTRDTPTTNIIMEHFNEPEDNGGRDVRSMLRENWRLLERGYLFVNSDHSRNYKRSPVEQLEVYDMMIEYLCFVCKVNKPLNFSGSVRIIAFGTAAHHIAVSVSSRLRANGFQSTATLDGQPARFSRLTYGRDRVGISRAYTCLSASTMKLFRSATSEWFQVQGSLKYIDRLHEMSGTGGSNLSTVFMTTISKLIEQISNHMNNAPDIPSDSAEVTPELTIEAMRYSQESTRLFYELTCALAADTGVKQTITEKIIASAAANSQHKRVTQSVVSSGVQKPVISSANSVASGSGALSVKAIGGSTGGNSRISSKLKQSLTSTPKKSTETSTDAAATSAGDYVPDTPVQSAVVTEDSLIPTTLSVKKPSVEVVQTDMTQSFKPSSGRFSRLKSPPTSKASAAKSATVTNAPPEGTTRELFPSLSESKKIEPKRGGLFAKLPRKDFSS